MNITLDELVAKIKQVDEGETDMGDHTKIKVVGAPGPGAKVKVFWGHLDIIDEGYIFTLPCTWADDIYMAGIIHIPHPRCPEGDFGPESAEWHTLDEILSNPLVEKIQISEI